MENDTTYLDYLFADLDIPVIEDDEDYKLLASFFPEDE